MLSLLLVASFALPSVLGHCCLPDKLSAVIIEAGSNSLNHFLLDFTQKKFLFKPFDQSHVDFVLSDMNSMKTYQMNHDGVCHIHDLGVASSTYEQCLTDGEFAGSGYLGPFGKMNVDSYVIQHGDVKSVITVTRDNCIPVASYSNDGANGAISTHFWTNVTTVTDVSDLNVDLANCNEEETAG